MPVVTLEHIDYAYPPAAPGVSPGLVLRDVELTVERGEFLSLMGPTGAGKSTLCMTMNGLVPRSTGGLFRGRAVILGEDTRRTPVAQLAQRVGIVFQDPESQFFRNTVEDELAFGPENLGVDPAEIRERITWALQLVGLPDHALRAPTQLSGGQKQRVAIAAALTLLPDLLILDEPASSLDPVGRREVFSSIDRLSRERNMTIVMASQDAEHVAEFSDRVAILYEGHIPRVDEPLTVFEDGQLLFEAGLVAPQVTQIALQLNKTHETDYHFARLDHAHLTLASALTEGDDDG